MSDENEEKKGPSADPEAGKRFVDEKTGEYHSPDKSTMYKEWFNQAKQNAISRGNYATSLISLDEIKGIKKVEKSTKKKITKKATKKRK